MGFLDSKTVWKTVLCAIFNGIFFGILSSAIRVEQKPLKIAINTARAAAAKQPQQVHHRFPHKRECVGVYSSVCVCVRVLCLC